MLLLVSNVILLCTLVSSRTLPSYIKKCSLSDPKLSQCIQDRVNESASKFSDGRPELGVVKFEPFFFEKLDLGKTGTLQQSYDTINVHGLSTLTVSNLESNFADDNCYVKYDAFIPQLRFDANYKMNGNLLLFAINAAGKCNNILYDISTQHHYKCEKFMKKGKKYIRISDYQFSMQPKNIVFNFSNLLEGSNQNVEREILKTVNENSISVFNDFKPAFEKTFQQIFIELGNNVYSKFPQDELFLP